MSYLDHVTLTAGFPLLAAAHGDAHGKPIELKIYPPGYTDGDPLTWAAVVDRLGTAQVEDFSGTHERQENRESTVALGPTPATPILMGSTVGVPCYPGERFEIENIESNSSLTRLTLYRIMAVDIQRHGVTRGR